MVWVVTRMTCDTHRHSPAAADALLNAIILRLYLQLSLADALADALGWHAILLAAYLRKIFPKKTLREN